MSLHVHTPLGHGVRSYHRSIGSFELRAARLHRFSLLEEAYACFQGLEEAASLWDVTDVPELLESK